MSDDLIAIDFRVDGEVKETVQAESVPEVGETVEVGAKFTEVGDRIDPSDSERWHDFDAEYRTVLSGEVTDVTRHYCSAPRRSELTAYVDIDPGD